MKDIKVLPREDCIIIQLKPLVRDFKIRKVKEKIFRKIRKLHEDNVKNDFRSYIKKYRAGSQRVASVEGYRKVLKGALLEATDRSCGWTKDPAKHKET